MVEGHLQLLRVSGYEDLRFGLPGRTAKGSAVACNARNGDPANACFRDLMLDVHPSRLRSSSSVFGASAKGGLDARVARDGFPQSRKHAVCCVESTKSSPNLLETEVRSPRLRAEACYAKDSCYTPRRMLRELPDACGIQAGQVGVLLWSCICWLLACRLSG